ncbi:angiopoietin-related protein 7 isoform X1 [Latimeria chalumnae]|uniref:angiopoietin-related protein 7 isoform X1 n=1 Tax=Latimeria chalumnae TaxID=7897 RepID=UPI0003C1562F|nr:PREDICTED: angiopoietin-related protein 7 isoform X1 [Latimeria chalumnae]|eukprot:XP_005994067.1 PREDICTED: angiopoietin-related protein 7 isoform X1 [Latimeria chalumnae]
MHKKVAFGLLSLCILIAISTLSYAQSKKAQRRRTTTGGANLLKLISCCDDLKELKVQVANLTSILTDLSKKQETDWINVVMQVMDLEGNYRQVESRITEAEGKYSEMNNRIDIMQLQAAQTVTQTSADAVYDCSSLYHRSYKISGVYKLPADEFLGTPELEVFCDMETEGGGWTIIQRRKIGLTSFHRDWKQYKTGFGNIRGDFWLGNENIFRLTRQPSVLRVELEDWNGNLRYAEYNSFSLGNELNSYRLFLGDYTGNAGRDSLRYHNNTAFSTKDKDNDKCVDDCAEFRKGGYWYNCCTDSNLNGVYYRHGEHTKHSDGISWYGWHGSSYSLKQVEMKIRPQNFTP